MILEGTIYCEAEGCKRHAHVGADTMRLNRLPDGFVKLIQYGSNGGEEPNAFCGLNCALKWLSKFPPPEMFRLGDDGELRRVDDEDDPDAR